ncbi:hypothetical protein SLEP1_g2133 [Rubroshorea leprosula]|uniref:non-specific serine/threonine protein kinase n=1 Tax=Rubroshorea leprosula TaxID=152421 RepID=A0AAV5HMQ2_9ROSI|nr:hypothetical protein SLEP1_g2133 [Rubroshorea leprosula]
MNMVRSLMSKSGLPKEFWPEAINWSVHILNRSPTSPLPDLTLEEAWSGRRPTVDYFRIFGSIAYAHVPDQKRSKLDDKREKCIFLGVSDQSKAYRLYNPLTKKVIISRDNSEGQTSTDLEVSRQTTEESLPIEIELNIGGSLPTTPELEFGTSSRPQHKKRRPTWLEDYEVTDLPQDDVPVNHFALFVDCDSLTYEEAVKEEKWQKAMAEEIGSIERNQTWELTDLPEGHKTIGVKWIYKTKLKENGAVDKFKARLVAKGYKQEFGIDYQEVFAPVARMDTIRLVIALAAQNSWPIYQLDVKFAFLHGICKNRFQMKNCNSVTTPIDKGVKLMKDPRGKSVDSKLYKQIVGSLMYLIATRPDIMHGILDYSTRRVTRQISQALQTVIMLEIWMTEKALLVQPSNFLEIQFYMGEASIYMDFNEGLGSCGFNSYCTIDSNARPNCECLPGFIFSDPNNKFNGCIQDRIQECNMGPSKVEDLYDMHELPNTFWPTSVNFEWTPSNEDECRQSCLYDCQCVVAVLREGGCSKKKKLPLTNGMVTKRINGKAFVKVARSINASSFPSPEGPGPQKKDQSSVIRVGSFLLGGSAFINFLHITAGSILAIWSCNKRQKPDQISSTLESNPRPFTYQDLAEATDGFKEELGRGAFGTVYKGVLRFAHSTIIPIAVKKLDKLMQEVEKEFKTEVNAIAKTHHKNLVSLIGFCEEGLHKLLVYEFMSNGTLASLLYGDCRPEWKSRTQWAFEIARGLVYLHEECSIPIIHCDIKPQNILLDDSFTARISDFGLAKLLMSDQTRTTTAIRGTKGYVAPEWFRNTPITTKIDVYSYGVMLLEIICCRKNYEVERENEDEVILTDWVYDCYKKKRLDRVVENDEEAINDMTKVERLVMVAIWCIQEDPSLRPSMRKVTKMLEGVVQVPMPPCPTPFTSSC